MIEIVLSNNIINDLALCITHQNEEIELQYSHLLRYDYQFFLSRFDFKESGFQHFYSLLISNTLKKYIASQRAVYSTLPSSIICFPNSKYSHSVSHPLCKNCYSVFVPLTQWTESNTIRVKNDNKSVPIGHKENSCYIIKDDEDMIIPEHCNSSNNTHFGLFFYIMSYENYKSSIIYTSKNVGGFFSLL